MTERYALYFAPDSGSPLAEFGETILGRSPNEPRSSTARSSFTNKERWLALTSKPAHYGFHATLKAPFELSVSAQPRELFTAVEAFALQTARLPLPGLAPRRLSNFLALTLDQQSEKFSKTVFSIVKAFEPFRKALSKADRERRLCRPLSLRQIELLDCYGYPYVADEFRFHMTLSSPLSEQDDDYQHWVEQEYNNRVKGEAQLNRLAVYQQADRHSAFIEVASFPLSKEGGA